MRVGVVGHQGGKENFVDGQTVKVKSFVHALTKYATNVKLNIVDTYYCRKNPIVFVWDLVWCLLRCKHIVFFPAFTGRQYMFKTFYWLGKLTGRRFYHDCIAGSLADEIVQHPDWVRYLNSFYSNWMESPSQAEILRKMGVENASYLPNFKPLEPVELSALQTDVAYPKRFVVFSRIEEKKGIEDALSAIKDINENLDSLIATLDIYGPIQPGSEEWFKGVLAQYKDIANYRGVVGPFESVSVLKNYFALLFPTRYYTEGMPGTIVDAMFAGLPVIARRWAWCDGMIISGYNGISYDFDTPELLKIILERVVKEPTEILRMKINCIKESEKYSDKSVIKTILSELKRN